MSETLGCQEMLSFVNVADWGGGLIFASYFDNFQTSVSYNAVPMSSGIKSSKIQEIGTQSQIIDALT